MSFADLTFINNLKDIIETGVSDQEFDVRPKWKDGTPAHTIKKQYIVNRYRLSLTSIPVLTLRKQYIKNAVDEILWIYQKKTSKLEELHSHVWDDWNVGDGTIGRAYGYQIGKVFQHHKVSGNSVDVMNADKLLDHELYPSMIIHEDWVWMDQMDSVLYDLRNNPASRSIMTNMFNHQDLHAMGLRPCAYSMTYNVTKVDGQLYLNGMLNQRSQDMITANNWNVIQYATLLQMIARSVNMIPGEFVHVIADCHIYDRHMEYAHSFMEEYNKALLRTVYGDYSNFTALDRDERADRVPYPNPTFWLNPDVTNFYQFTPDDVKLENYQYLPFDHKIEVAI